MKRLRDLLHTEEQESAVDHKAHRVEDKATGALERAEQGRRDLAARLRAVDVQIPPQRAHR